MGSSFGGQWCFSWIFSSATETLLQSEGSQSGPILPEKTEAEVGGAGWRGVGRYWGVGGAGGGSREGLGLVMAVSAQAVLEDDGCTREPSGLGDTLVQGDAEEAPVVAGLGPDTEDLEGQSPPQSQPSSPDACENHPCAPLHSPPGRSGGPSAWCPAWLWSRP